MNVRNNELMQPAEVEKLSNAEMKIIMSHFEKNNEDDLIEYITTLYQCYQDKLPALLNDPCLPININNELAYVPIIHMATFLNHTKLITNLYEYGVDIQQQVSIHRKTPLSFAADNNKVEAFKSLLELHVDLAVKLSCSYTLTINTHYTDILYATIMHAISQNTLASLFSDKKSNDNIFESACKDNNLDSINLLLRCEPLMNKLTIEKALHHLLLSACAEKKVRDSHSKFAVRLRSVITDEKMLLVLRAHTMWLNDIDNIHRYLVDRNESGLLKYIQMFPDRYGAQLPVLLNYKCFKFGANSDKCMGSLIQMAAIANFADVIKVLHSYGADINQLGYQDHRPVMLACGNTSLNALDTLLKLSVCITGKDSSANTIVLYLQNYLVIKKILSYAKENNVLEQILSDKKSNDAFFHKICERGTFKSLRLLLSYPYFKNNLDIELALHRLRFAAWDSKNRKKSYDKLCQDLHTHVGILSIPNFELDEMKNATPSDDGFNGNDGFPNIRKQFFRNQLSLSEIRFPQLFPIKDKTESIQRVILHINDFIKVPQRCYEFLRHLNAQLIDYISETHQSEPQKILPDSTFLSPVTDVMYRFPKSTEYQGLHKKHALQDLLVSILKKYGLANHLYKWIGSVPGRVASQMLGNGDFVTEGRLGIGLFHGTLSHMIHIIFCIYIIESGQINTSYLDNNGSVAKITIQDILSTLFKYRHPKSGDTLFKAVFDTRVFNKVMLGDPHRLTSLITCYGSMLGFEVLSDYMADSFIKGFLALLKLHNSNRKIDNQLSIMDLIKQFSQTQIHVFHNPKFIAAAAFDAERKKPNTTVVESNDIFMVVEKSHRENKEFEPKRFTMK